MTSPPPSNKGVNALLDELGLAPPGRPSPAGATGPADGRPAGIGTLSVAPAGLDPADAAKAASRVERIRDKNRR